MSFTRAVAHNTVIQTGGKILSTLLGLVTFALLARYLGQEGFGQYTTIFAYLGFFSVLADFGLYVIVVRELGRKERSEGFILGNLLGLRLALAVSILALGILVSAFFPYPGTVKTGILIGSFSFLFVAVVQLLVGLFQAHLKTVWVVLAEVAGRIVVIGLLFLLIAAASPLVLIVLAVVAGSFVNLVFMLWATRRIVRLRLQFDRAYWRYLVRETLPIAVSVILNLLYFRLDTIFLSLFRSTAEVGLYGAAYKILEILVTFPNMFIGLILPTLSFLALRDPERFRRVFQRAFDLLLAASLPLLVGGIFLARPLLVFISGEAFAAAVPIFQLLLFAVFALFLGSLSGYTIVAIGKQRMMVWGYLTVSVIGIATYLLLIPTFSFYGAAFGTILTETLIMAIGYFIILRDRRFRLGAAGALRAIAATGAMAAVLFALKDFGLFINLFAAAAAYLLALLLVGGIRRKEIREIFSTAQEGQGE
jgi:O-antigen/teichoic acid export membrane protein